MSPKTHVDALNASLARAIHQGETERAARCIRLGADLSARIDIPPDCGDTFATSACSRARADILSLLVQAGADIEARDSSGHTALICAIQRRSAPCVKILLAAGCDPDARESVDGPGPVHHAVIESRPDILALLIEAGCDVDALDQAGPDLGRNAWTACMRAASGGDEACLALLLRAGADLSRRDSSGFGALELSSALSDDDGGEGSGACARLIRADIERRALLAASGPPSKSRPSPRI